MNSCHDQQLIAISYGICVGFLSVNLLPVSSLVIGVTTHEPCDLEFPSTMTNVRSGTWMMTGNGVMHNGTTTIDAYGQNLDKLKVGDRVGVVRKDSGILHFFVNGDDQGPAATNVPEIIYGVIDLYGQAAQATIIDVSDYRQILNWAFWDLLAFVESLQNLTSPHHKNMMPSGCVNVRGLAIALTYERGMGLGLMV